MTPHAPAGFSVDLVPAGAGFPGLEHLKNNFREWYSWSVVASVVTAAGLVCHVPTIDANKTDMRVETLSLWNGRQRTIRLQLKASSNIGKSTVQGVDYVTHSFDRDYYDEMQEDATIPLFLVLVALPALDKAWTRLRPNIVALSAAAWWGEVLEPSNGKESQTVRIPVSQRFDLAALQTMLSKA